MTGKAAASAAPPAAPAPAQPKPDGLRRDGDSPTVELDAAGFERAGLAIEGRRADPAAREALWDRLNTEPWGSDFFALVRRLEALHPELPGFGFSNRAGEDPLRFCQNPSLAFPPCTLAEFEFPRANSPARLFVNFMGMWGPNGPLPLHLTEHAHMRELHHKDFTLSRFLDVFNHRLVSLHYRTWAASSMPASFDRWQPVPDGGLLTLEDRVRVLSNDRDRYAMYVGSLLGLGMETVRHRDAVPDRSKLHFAGRLIGHQRGPEGLRAILAAYFRVEAYVDEFAGRWMDLPPSHYCRLGGAGEPTAAQLGTQSGGCSVAGMRVWDCQGMFRVRLGPMDFDDYQRLLPPTNSAGRLEAWIRNYVGDEFAWEVVLTLRSKSVPKARLGKGARLGWTTWVYSGACAEDRGDLVIRSKR